MKISRIVLVSLFGLLSAASFAQTGKVLKGKEITESALIDALTPDEKEGSDPSGITYRSIRVRPDQPAPAAALAKPAKPASASLLITFETDSAQLTPRARSSLDVVARALNADKLAEFRFSIEGHADPRGGHEHNLQLSQARAESVVDYLVSTHGIKRDRLKPQGKGDSELMNTAKPDAPENRRVTITTLRE